MSFFTKESYDKFLDELKDLKSRGRSEMAKMISEARDKGDLSENAEYDAAKDAQGLMEMKIVELETLLSISKIVDESTIDTSKVQPLTTVKMKNLKTGKEVAYTLVSEKEADIKMGKISLASPISIGVLNKRVGDVVEITVPAGILSFEILAITV